MLQDVNPVLPSDLDVIHLHKKKKWFMMFVVNRFQRQTHFNRSRPSDFKKAVNEAILADLGFEEGHEAMIGKVHPSMAEVILKVSTPETEEADDDVSTALEPLPLKPQVKVHH